MHESEDEDGAPLPGVHIPGARPRRSGLPPAAPTSDAAPEDDLNSNLDDDLVDRPDYEATPLSLFRLPSVPTGARKPTAATGQPPRLQAPPRAVRAAPPESVRQTSPVAPGDLTPLPRGASPVCSDRADRTEGAAAESSARPSETVNTPVKTMARVLVAPDRIGGGAATARESRTSRPDATSSVQDDLSPNDARPPSPIELIWGRWPGGQWVPASKGLVDVVREEQLGGLRLALLLGIVAQRRSLERSSRFPFDTTDAAHRLGIKRRTVSDNLHALGLRPRARTEDASSPREAAADAHDGRPHELLEVGTGLEFNRTWVDFQQLRFRVSGDRRPLEGGVRSLNVGAFWGFLPARAPWFAPIPEPIREMMNKDYLPEEMTWLALFAVAVKYARTQRKTFIVPVTKFAKGMNVPERSARRCLQILATADEGRGRPPLIRKASERPRGRWVIDVSPLLEAIARWEWKAPSRSSERSVRSAPDPVATP